MSDARPGRRGFTLIEVIGALVIFALGVLVTAALSGRVSDQVMNTTQRTEAGVVARQTLDSLMTVCYEDLSGDETVVEVAGRSYTRSWTVSDFGLRTREIRLVVTPPGSDTLTAYVADTSPPWGVEPCGG